MKGVVKKNDGGVGGGDGGVRTVMMERVVTNKDTSGGAGDGGARTVVMEKSWRILMMLAVVLVMVLCTRC